MIAILAGMTLKRWFHLIPILLMTSLGHAGCGRHAPNQTDVLRETRVPLSESVLRNLVGNANAPISVESASTRVLSSFVLQRASGQPKTVSTWVADVGAGFRYPLLRVEEPHADTQQSSTPLRVAVASHVLVRVKSGVSHPQLASIDSVLGYRTEPIPYVPDLYVAYLGDAQTASIRKQLMQPETMLEAMDGYLAHRDIVQSVEPDYLYTLAETAPTHPEVQVPSAMWGLHNTGQSRFDAPGIEDADIDAPEAWQAVYAASTPQVTVAVVDTGVDYRHHEFRSPSGESVIDTDHDKNFVRARPSDPPTDDAMDDHYHGTHVAGTIVASQDGKDAVGVSRNVRVLPIKILNESGVGVESDIVAAFHYLAQIHSQGSVKLLATSNSWGGSSYSEELYNAIKAGTDPTTAGVEPVLCVAAAGNDGKDGATYPAAYNIGNIISVGASTWAEQRAAYSNFGTDSVDLFAPGSGVLSTAPGDSYKYLDGTSMATPHVTAVAALVKQKFSTMQAAGIKARLLQSVDVKPQYAASVSGGRLNAENAVSDEPRLTLLSSRIDDNMALSPRNKPNEHLDPGETVDLRLSFHNVSDVRLAHALVSISAVDPNVKIISNAEFDLGEIHPWQVVSGQPEAGVRIDLSSYTSVSPIRLIVDVKQDGRVSARRETLTLPVGATRTIRGRVTLDGQPLEDVTVHAVGRAVDPTGYDGTFHLELDPSIEEVSLSLDRSDLLRSVRQIKLDHELFDLAINYRRVPFKVRVTKEGTLSPAANALVMLRGPYDTATREYRTDGSGRVNAELIVDLGTTTQASLTVEPSYGEYARVRRSISLSVEGREITVQVKPSDYAMISLPMVPDFLKGWGTGINHRGQVVGSLLTRTTSYNSSVAFAFSDHNRNGQQDENEITLIGDPYGMSTVTGVSDTGFVLFQKQSSRAAPVMSYLAASTGADLVYLGGFSPVPETFASAINTHGTIVGRTWGKPGGHPTWQGFVLTPEERPNGTLNFFKVGSGVGINALMRSATTSTEVNAPYLPTDINSHHHIAGTVGIGASAGQAFVWHKGLLGHHGYETFSTECTGHIRNVLINDRNDVVINGAKKCVVVRSAKSSLNDVASKRLEIPGENIFIKDINNLDEWVGTYDTYSPALWRIQRDASGSPTGAEMVPLDDIAPPNTFAYEVNAINDCGEIVGTQISMPHQLERPFLLRPIKNRGLLRVDAGPETVTKEAQTYLRGNMVSCHRDATPVSVQWSLVSGPARATFSAPAALTTKVEVGSAGTYVFDLEVRAGPETKHSYAIWTVKDQPPPLVAPQP